MIRVEIPGFGSTIQDAGRPSHVRAGVPVSGPADPFAFRAAQALVGNTEADAAIEAVGLPFAFRSDTSRIEPCTGRFLSCVNVARPNSNPSAATASPLMSSARAPVACTSCLPDTSLSDLPPQQRGPALPRQRPASLLWRRDADCSATAPAG